MDDQIAIKAENLEVSFFIQRAGINNFKDFILTMGLKSPFEQKKVLSGFNLSIKKGECLGILGKNGCGKSTLLRTIAGIMKPQSGVLEVNGKVAPLMALGAGLEPELTGMENIKLVGVLMGMSRENLKNSIDRIVEFSELDESEINMQVKRYSSGMMSKLAFSIAAATDPEILIIDEALAVGDLGFRRKCAHRINEIKAAGSTILYVSHHIAEIKNICTRAVFLKDGKMFQEGSVDEICDLYENELLKKK
jgi:ABC-2 type transport system ATP-binding protein/lipopolysaccharide transport system ATP-binding protein